MHFVGAAAACDMARFLDLLRDNSSVGGRVVTSGLILVLAALFGALIGRLVTHRTDDIFSRYYLRKVADYTAAFAATVSLALLWRPFAGNIGLVLGLATAGLAFAMQEVIGALAGWVNILSGRIYRIGDRIEVGGVRGDVIDIAPLRTKLMEIGASSDDPSVWVRGTTVHRPGRRGVEQEDLHRARVQLQHGLRVPLGRADRRGVASRPELGTSQPDPRGGDRAGLEHCGCDRSRRRPRSPLPGAACRRRTEGLRSCHRQLRRALRPFSRSGSGRHAR